MQALSPWASRTAMVQSPETLMALLVLPMAARGIILGTWRCGARTRVLIAVHTTTSTTTASARSSSHPAHAHHRSGSSMKRNACKLLSPWASRTAMVQSPETLMALLVVPMAARGIILGMWKCGARTRVLIAVHTTTNASARLLALQVLQRLPQQCPHTSPFKLRSKSTPYVSDKSWMMGRITTRSALLSQQESVLLVLMQQGLSSLLLGRLSVLIRASAEALATM